MDALTPELFNGVGVVALLGALFWMLATGRLVTRREADGYREDRDAWKRAYETEAQGNVMQSAQFSELLESSRTQRAFLESLQKAAGA